MNTCGKAWGDKWAVMAVMATTTTGHRSEAPCSTVEYMQ